MPNYNYVINSSYKPYSLQEMLVPLEAYKEAYNEAEEKYLALSKGANEFEYLANTLPDGSKAKEIYNNYANDLREQAKDFETNGLNISNRGALTTLRRRYTGEIGRLEKANEVLQEELKRRRENKDTSMLYGNNNLTIDDFLDNNTPNLYKISGNELMSLGEEWGKNLSQRMYRQGEAGNIMGGQYNLYKETQGMSPEEINRFMATEGIKIADNILAERGVTGNLSDYDYHRARQSVMNGLYNGIVYNESVKPYSNGEYRSADSRDSSARGWSQLYMSAAHNQLKPDGHGGWVPDEAARQRELEYQTKLAIAKKAGTGSSGSGASYDARNKGTVIIGADTGTVYKGKDEEGDGQELDNLPARALTRQEYSSLLDAYGNITNEYLRSVIGNGNIYDYEIYVVPSGSTEKSGTGWFDDDDLDENVYIVKPRESKRSATESSLGVPVTGGLNDIPD